MSLEVNKLNSAKPSFAGAEGKSLTQLAGGVNVGAPSLEYFSKLNQAQIESDGSTAEKFSKGN